MRISVVELDESLPPHPMKKRQVRDNSADSSFMGFSLCWEAKAGDVGHCGTAGDVSASRTFT